MAPGAPASTVPLPFPDSLLHDLLAVSLTAVNVLRPIYDPAGTIVDFTLDYLNPAAQRMAALPERPAGTLLELRPSTAATGVLDYYRRAFETGAPEVFEVNYQADGLDNYFRLAARRSGEWLVVSFTDTADQPRTAVEVALRAAQAREQAALAEAEQRREELDRLFEQAPVALAVFRGPRYVVEMANPEVLRLWGRTPAQALHTPLFELLPEISGQGFEELLDQVVATGMPHVAHEMPSTIARHGRLDTVYWNFVYQPLPAADGVVGGVMVVATEVSEQVLARRQVQELNQELEARVFERTQALRHAQAGAEAAAQRLERTTASLPSTTFTADATGRVLSISPQWYAYTGMAPGTNISEAWPALMHPADLTAVAREYAAALADGRPWSYEFRLRGADGHYRWFASQGVPEPLAEAEAAGRPRQWFGANLDIHELRQAQRRLERQDQRLQEILRQAPAMIATLDGPEHRFAFTNAGYDALVGHRARPGASVAECLPEVVAQGFIGLLDGVYRSGEPYMGYETPIEFQPPGGAAATYYLDFTYQPLRDEQGQTTGVLAFVVDATERVSARQQAEAGQTQLLAAARQQAQEREAFRHVFEQTPALIALLRDPGHRFEYVNPAYQAVFPRQQLVGLEVAEAAPELAAQGFAALLDAVYQTGETHFGLEVPFTPRPAPGKAPRTSYFNFTYQAYREAGAVAGVSIFAFDVTELVLARQQRDAEREQLQAVFAQAPVAVCVFQGEDYVLDLVNPPMAQMLGRPLPTLLGQPFFRALPELRDQGVPALLDGVRRTGTPFVAQELAVQLAHHPAGQPGYYNFVYQPLHDDTGSVAGIVCVATDVTEQVRARRAVEASARQLRLVTDALPVLIGYLDREERYRFANRAYEGWFNQPAENLLGRPIREVAGPLAYAQVQPYIRRALAGERVEFEAEMPFRPGFTRHIRTSYIPDVQAGAVPGFYTLVTDVTEQVLARRQVEVLNEELAAINEELRATNEELQESNAQLTRTNVDLDTFVYTASHDLKAPISNIEGLLTLLGEELPPAVVQGETVAPALGHMREAVERFKRTIDHLTDVAKLQNEHAPVEAAVDLAAVVEDVRRDLAPLLRDTNARLLVALDEGPAVWLSEKNLRSIIYNLLSNALKYRSPHRAPHVDVRAHLRPGFTVLEVHDNGLGLEAAQLPKLFGLFQRFHSHVEGTGIGLYMVKRMVENAGGRIEVHSEPGAGTTFFVHLPHAPARPRGGALR